MPSLPALDRQAIISFCERNEAEFENLQQRPFLTFEPYFIKCDDHFFLKFQCETQRYIYNKAIADPSAPRVPAVVDYFTDVEECKGYLVTELIDAATPADNAHEMVASALQWLRSVPAPHGATIGTVGGGPARHETFKDFEAPLLFTDNESLQIYMNALSWYSLSIPLSMTVLSNDK